MSATVFNRGIPTAPDVKAIEDAIGVPKEGELIPWERFEKVLGIERNAARFRTVVGAWRKRLFRDLNILVSAVAGKGLEVLDAHGRVTTSGGWYKSGLRKVSRAGTVADRTDAAGLSVEDRRALDHIRGSSAALRLLASTRAKELPPIK